METKITEAGEMRTTKLGDTTLYTIYTKAGFFRGGYRYSVVKHCVLVSGKCELIMSHDGETDEIKDLPLNQVVDIPANVPNIFRFLTDGILLEWFCTDPQKTDFPRYKEMKK